MLAPVPAQQQMHMQVTQLVQAGPVGPCSSTRQHSAYIKQPARHRIVCPAAPAAAQQAASLVIQQAPLLQKCSCTCSSYQRPLGSSTHHVALQLGSSRGSRRKSRLQPCHLWGRNSSGSNTSSSTQPADPWRQPGPSNPASPLASGEFSNGSTNPSRSSSPSTTQIPGPIPTGVSPTDSYDPWDAARPRTPVGGAPEYDQTDWGWGGAGEDWDPAEGLGPDQLADLERDYLDQVQRRRAAEDPPRDKWITPLLDWQSIYGAFDPDQSRTEDAMADEALTNKEESREALAFTGRLVVVPLVTGALISRAITEPVLSFSLQNNPNAFAMTERQKIEGAAAVHMEETRVKMMMAIGQAPPLDDAGMLRHLQEFAHEIQEEERHKNEANLMTLVSDSISAMVFFVMFVRDNLGRAAIFNTIGRLFEGLSDIAKAVLIILVADTLLGYHSEEGWTGLIDLVLGHYGIEVEEENIVLFVGIIPIAIDVMFKYWIFIGLNKISPGAVVTIKQLDRH